MVEGLQSPSFLISISDNMIEKQKVVALVEEWLKDQKDYFLVDVTVGQDNNIVVEIDNADGVWIEDCAQLSRFIESGLDRDVEDFDLEVGSAGIGQPFKVLRQYENHIGKEVEVQTAAGTKVKGILSEVTADSFVVTTKQKQTVEGSKRPVVREVPISFRYDEINYTKYLISLK